MEKILAIIAVLVIRWLFSANKTAQKKKTVISKKQENHTAQKNAEDIFSDLIQDIQTKKNKPITKSINSGTDWHKAEEDTQKIDWQEVHRSTYQEKEELLKIDNVRKSKKIYSPEVKPIIETNEKNSEELDLEYIDLKKAVIYKEILDRKYFTI